MPDPIEPIHVPRLHAPTVGLTAEGIDRANAATRERLAEIVGNPRPQGDSEEQIWGHVRTWILPMIDRSPYSDASQTTAAMQGSQADALFALSYQIVGHPAYVVGRDPVADVVAGYLAKAAGYLRVARTTRCPETRRYQVAAAAHYLNEGHGEYTALRVSQKAAA